MEDGTGIPLAPWPTKPRYVEDANGCWIWQRACNNKGYGQLWIPEQGRLWQAHRWMYERHKGPIPPGWEIDKRTHPRRPPPDQLREPPKTGKVDTADCILWYGSRDRDGYGHKSVNGRTTFVRRLAYEQHYGPIPEGMQIDHLCRSPACYNPEHLEAVTPQENALRGDRSFGVRPASTARLYG